MTTTLLDRLLWPGQWLHPGRILQMPQLPDYTSPPTADALAATPEAFRSDEVVDAARAAAAAGNCTVDGNRCHIPFPVTTDSFDFPVTTDSFVNSPKVGVVFYGGALVDPRAYAPLASMLASRYGLPTVIPIFSKDVALPFGTCDTGRLDLAKWEFESVEHWLLVGHSLGGVAAMLDLWTRRIMMQDGLEDESAGGLVLLASNVQSIPGCGDTDFSNTSIPMATVLGTEDLILNVTREELSTAFLPKTTFFMDIYGGNHGQFGSYDGSQRMALLNQTDGIPLIPPQIQWDLSVSAIAHAASRIGVDLPQVIVGTTYQAGSNDSAAEEITTTNRCNPDLEEGGSTPSSSAFMMGYHHTVTWTWMTLLLTLLRLCKRN